MTTERWKKIKGYPKYQVSSLGRVQVYGKIYAPQSYRYPKATLINKEGEIKSFAIHRLVATAFIPNPFNKPFVNHINCITTDNRVENLEWCTQSENIKHAVKLGRHKSPRSGTGKFGAQSSVSKPVAQKTLEGQIVATFPSMRDAAKAVKVHENYISNVCRGIQKTSKGFLWEIIK